MTVQYGVKKLGRRERLPGLVGGLSMTARCLEAGVLGGSLAAGGPAEPGGPAELAEAGGVAEAMGPSLSWEVSLLRCCLGLLAAAAALAGMFSSSSSTTSAAMGHVSGG